jgi:hypothetical protein
MEQLMSHIPSVPLYRSINGLKLENDITLTAPAIGASGGLAIVYDLDFSTLTAQDLKIGGDGAKTIGGKTWNLVNSANASSVYLNDGAHSGLYVRCNTTSTDDYGSNYSGPRLQVGLSDLCGVAARDALEMWVLIQASQPHAPNANYESMRWCIGQSPSLPDTGGAYRRFAFSRGIGPSIACELHPGGGIGFVYAPPASTATPDPSSDVFAFRLFSNTRIEMYVGKTVGGTFPPLDSLTFLASAPYFTQVNGWDAPSITNGSSASFQWSLSFNVVTVNTVGNSDALTSKLRIISR